MIADRFGRLGDRLRFRRRAGRRAIILYYHRVADLSHDAFHLAVRPGLFAQHMDVVARHCRPLSLAALVDALHGGGDIPERAVAVTFDDGYADNAEAALPLLERFGVPATMFVTTGYIDGAREFWWDELERLLFTGERLPESLSALIGGRPMSWTVANGTARPGTVDRRGLLWQLHAALRPLGHDERCAALDQLRAWSGHVSMVRRTHRPLSAGEVTRLASSSVVELGAHTETHPVLQGLPAETQEREILSSRRRLQALTGREVRFFAYPYGTSADYDGVSRDTVRRAGFAAACTTTEDVVRPGVDAWQLPRVAAKNRDGDWLRRMLDRHEAGG